MARLRHLWLLLLLLLSATISSAEPNSSREQFFSINLPDGFHLEKQYAVDFIIFRITDGQRPYVAIYVGEAPDESATTLLPGETRQTFQAARTRFTSIWKGNRIDTLEILIQRSNLGDVPNYVQAWTLRDAPDKQEAQRILLSLVVFDNCSQRTIYGFC